MFIGRPALWGLAVGGQEGVQRVLQILRTELDFALQIAGKEMFTLPDHMLCSNSSGSFHIYAIHKHSMHLQGNFFITLQNDQPIDQK